jgi:hypothetical protein
VIFCPKFHSELNAIEGLWCSQKQFIRARTDQTYGTMLRLMSESRLNFAEKQIHLKLFRRFWRSLAAYKNGETYEQVLRLFFSHLASGAVKQHTRISNSKLEGE